MNQAKWIQAKKLALARDGHCIRCLGEPEVCHHRIPRGMGGRSDPEINYGLANIICLCNPCHLWVHENPEDAYSTGFLLHWWDDPEAVPLTVKPGSFFVKLTKNGDLEITKPLLLF